MGQLPRWRRYLRFWGPGVDADVEDELRFHLESAAAELEARGHDPEAAHRLARQRFGDVAHVRRWLRDHDRRRLRFHERIEHMEAILLDLRYALRKLRQQPAFSLSVILVLALGIGAATAMFSAVDAAMLRPLPFQRSDRLVDVQRVGIPHQEFSSDRSVYIDDVRAMHDVFSGVAAFAPGGLNLAEGDSPARVRVALVTPDLFPLLGVQPARGRGFTAEEGTLEGPRAALLSDGLWRRQFGGDPAIIGRDVRLNEVPYRVVGIMPPRFGFPQDTEIWLPLAVPNSLARWEPFGQYLPVTILGRLAPGATVAQAAARMHAAVRARVGEELDTPVGEFARPYREVLVGSRRTALLVLMGATALVLLVSCANVANLLLSRAAARRPEIALRAALGAGRARIIRQLLVESVILSMAGGLLGVLLARASLGLLTTLLPRALAGTVPARLDLRVLGFSLALALATGLVAGLWPAIGAARSNPNETMKGGSASSTTREGARMRRLFAVTQLALALTLAVGAGLMLRSMGALLGTETGVRAEGVATLRLSLARARYDSLPKNRQFVSSLLTQLGATPGVAAAALTSQLPMAGGGSVAFSLGEKGVDGGSRIMGQEIEVTGEYFEVLGIPLLRGRLATPALDSGAPREMVVNQALARALWPGEDPIGRQYTVMEPIPPRTVVGVVGDVRGQTLADEPMPQMFVPLEDAPGRNLALVARGPGSPALLGARLADAVHAVDPGQAVFDVRPMEDVIRAAIAPRRTNALLIAGFGAVAMVLAAIGVYGVVAYGVTRRTREFGIRVALGATRRDVLGLVLREGLAMAAAGVVLGMAGAWALRRTLASMLYGVAPGDPLAFAGAAVVLVIIALLATLLPARQALRVDPARTMRVE